MASALGGFTKENGRATRSPSTCSAIRTNCPASKARGPARTWSEKRASVQCRFSITRPCSHLSLIAIRLQAQVLQLAAEHDDGAMPAVVPGVGKFKAIRPRNAQLALVVPSQRHARERDS